MNHTLEWLWLSHVLGHGSPKLQTLLELYQNPAQLKRAVGREDLSPFFTSAQLQRLEAEPEEFSGLLTRCGQLGVQILTMEDERYPKALLELEDAPPVLFATGHPEVLNQMPCVGMIGSRRPSEYGVQAAGVIGGRLAKEGVCIISGLADGLDGCCHRAAVEQDRPTVGILGTAIDRTYPAANRMLRRQMEQRGAVLSEYAPGETTNSHSFLQRNRLIAGTSQALCVVEARQRSGTMNTVHHAQRYRRPVFAVPGTIFSDLCAGTNQLLEEGIATAAASAAPILASLGMDTRRVVSPARRPGRVPAKAPSSTAQRVLETLSQTPRSAEELSSAAGIDIASVLAALLELELSGFAQSCAGGLYRRK